MKVAHALINPVITEVPVRLLNLSYDTTTVFKGTKVATVEECETIPVRAMNVTTVEEEMKPEMPESKRQLLEKMTERCTGELEQDHKEQFH